MQFVLYGIFILLSFLSPNFLNGELYVGIGKADITPPIGTPSAGYTHRNGKGMEGVHDPLLAIAFFIDNGEKSIVLCSVDHLGFTYEMVQNITQQVKNIPELSRCDIYIASSHTHSGGGAFLNIPILGERLAGCYNPKVTKYYEEQTVNAILQAAENKNPAKIGIGYGKVENLSKYRGLWPIDVEPLSDVTIIKATQLDGTPIAVLFNYPVHPTVLTSENRLFSSDFVGYARDEIQALLGPGIQPIYFNGAQGDIIPFISNEENRFESCSFLGKCLAETIKNIWCATEVKDILQIDSYKKPYEFIPQPTPQGLKLPINIYKSEINVLVFNQTHAFVTIPGELSCVYDKLLKKIGKDMGYQQVSIFGLVNDAHGYIILPESWERKTFESNLSFGGKQYGEIIKQTVHHLLEQSFLLKRDVGASRV
jgi:Neutral/alkaline non-lysosomal ceramidase, N-terminal